MDTITTGIGGALLAKALPEETRGPAGVWAVTLAAILPDADVFANFLTSEPLARLAQHRSFTHSLVGIVIMAPILALLLRRFGPDKRYRRLLALVLLGLAWHLFIDLATSWGTQVFFPFNRERVVWDLLFIVDFAFTALLLLPQLLAWTSRQPAGAVRRGALIWLFLVSFAALVISIVAPIFEVGFRWAVLAWLAALLAGLLVVPRLRDWGFRQRRATFCRLGVAMLAVYLGLCTGAHFAALGQVEKFAAARGLTVEARAALPQPLSPFRWSGLVLTPKGVYQSWFNVLEGGGPVFEFYPRAQNEYVARAKELDSVKTYLWFARFPVARYRPQSFGGRRVHIVEWSDRRFVGFRGRNPPFSFRVTFNEEGEVLQQGFPSD